MYTPPAFRDDDRTSLHDAIRSVGLATLVTHTPAGLVATPLPLLLEPDEGPLGTLYGHVARANPQAALPATCDALVIFPGPDAYVSPGWYPSKAEHGRVVPTWNYAAVHASGPAEFFEEAGRLHDVVTRLTDHHEASRPAPWAVTDAPERYISGQLRGITGVRIAIARLEGKRKFSQNRGEADREGVALGLLATGDPASRAVAALIPRSGDPA